MASSKEAIAQAYNLIDLRDYSAAIVALESVQDDDSNGNLKALMGLALFLAEDYEKAKACYQIALLDHPKNSDWAEMVSVCQQNIVARVDLVIPPISHFDRDTLLVGPRPGSLPGHLEFVSPDGLGKRIRVAIGNGLGAACSVTMEGLTAAWGSLAGYKGRVWTTWYKRPVPLGILTLAFMRNRLNKMNLKDTYPEGSLTGFVPTGLTPPAGASDFRTADGSWNNFDNPMEGAAGTRFPRNVELSAIKPETGELLMTPNPREVSRIMLQRGEKAKEVEFLNLLAASWIQFQNDDWVNHGDNLLNEYHEIPLADDDPARTKFGQSVMRVGKTQPDPTRIDGKEDASISFINEVTHWWDGSQIYGSSQETQDRLRSKIDGKMRLSPENTLPRDERGIEDSGMVRNWWVGLSMLHTLFVREHNAICDRLKAAHSDWDDNRLFNVARLINCAVMAKVHTVEWTPAVLPNPGLDTALNANWFGILTNLFKKGKQRKTVADVNVRNPELGGVVGNPIDKHGCHYGLAEEFVEVYRLHSFLPETLKLQKHEGSRVTEIPFVETRQFGAGKLAQDMSMADLLFTFGNQHPGQLVLNNYPHFMRQLSIPGNAVFDMGAVDILRARERGIPRYNEFRRQLGLNGIQTFEDLFSDLNDPEQCEQLNNLKALYKGDVEMLDLLVGTLGEGYRPTGFGFGETMFQIFILNATRRLQADRFYTDCYDEAHYTQEGLQWIDDSDLKTVILRHYPELAKTGLGNIKNAFEPWDLGPLDKARHPLREWNSEVKSDPWRGDLR